MADTALLGHPSCMQLKRVADVVRTYPWKCIECKNCELCQEKGDDVSSSDWCIGTLADVDFRTVSCFVTGAIEVWLELLTRPEVLS